MGLTIKFKMNIKEVINSYNIKRLKKKATWHYLAYWSIAREYDSGLSLTEFVSSELTLHKEKFNKTMDKLSKIDPNAPTDRL